MKFSRKILFVPLLAVIFFWNAAPVLAADLQVEFNPICWKQKECQDARAQFVGEGNSKSGDGWIENTAPCNQIGWGMCLPMNATKAQISFGGNADFSDVGVYIKTVYNYSLVIIGILAVVMIIISGAQWITSAGNSERIGAAKKRITGAIIGLFIAYMSYNILMSINPATINLRLPQIYMIRQQVVPSQWCREIQKEGQKFAWGIDATKQSEKITATNETAFNLDYDNSPPTAFWCGQRFFVAGASADTTCYGDRCEGGQLCTNADPVDEDNPYMCRQASIAGEVTGISNETAFFDLMFEGIDEGDTQLFIACNDGSSDGKSIQIDIDDTVTDDESGTKQSYMLEMDRESFDGAVEECGGFSKVLGAFMIMTFDLQMSAASEAHTIGANGVDIWGRAGDAGGTRTTNAVEHHPNWFKSSMFIPAASLAPGIRLNINAKKIMMVNDKSDFVRDTVILYKDSFNPGFPPEGLLTW